MLNKSEISSALDEGIQPRYRVMFWNVENLFDTWNDSLSNDDEFTPDGIRRWSYYRYKQKINNIYKVLVAAGNPSPPEIIGLCEVENRKVLTDITFTSPFLKYGYKIIHKDSRDRRGIDVAVIYDPSRVKILNMDFIIPYMLYSGAAETREIVYIEAVMHMKDTVHLFFNHWPSKYGGAGITEPLRKNTAKTLRNYIDSLQNVRVKAKIIIGGDFNDPPESISLRQVLGAECIASAGIESQKLYNLSCGAKPGTHKYQGIWDVIDQFIVSGNMLINDGGDGYRYPPRFNIFTPDFLLISDMTYSGVKPFRTWEGMKYSGGYSDHLPIILNVY